MEEHYRLNPSAPADLPDAERFCAELTRAHYENFTVVSWFLPGHLRQHFANVYAYCRICDDLTDEVADHDTALALLERWRGWLRDCYAGHAVHPVFVALAETIRQFQIPIDPFGHLLDAFVQDQQVNRYQTFEELLGYCRHSADPVGRLVLYLGGYRDEERQQLSDHTCTALQLANFWQDVRRDHDERDRVYLPLEDLERFGVSVEQIAARRYTPAYRELLRFEVERTRELFRAGLPLVGRLDGHVQRDVMLFTAGGWSILDLIEQRAYDTVTGRPALSKAAKLALMLRVMVGARMPWQ
ncbi:MAG: squalene synthase HpnC [Armatimonadetes bacterium]|nr:squalene synthase HpnC [Armatimonadota bacterium]